MSVPDWVDRLQRAFIYDQTQTYPLTIDANYNIVNKCVEPTIYSITSHQKNRTSD